MLFSGGSRNDRDTFKALLMNKTTAWEQAFGLVRYTVIPHYDRIRKHENFIHSLIGKSPSEVQNSWIGIDENTALLIDGEKQITLGSGSVDIHSINK